MAPGQDDPRRSFLLGIAAYLAWRPSRTWANGDDFFAGGAVPLMSQLIFACTVKDSAGNRLKDAKVTWTATYFDEGREQQTFAATYTDVMGRYRTVDVARTMAIYGYTLDPRRVEVTVTKAGYATASRLRRTRHDQYMGLIEVNFQMQKDEVTPE
jgi:hypothetical protein